MDERRQERDQGDVSEPGRDLFGGVRGREPGTGGRVSAGQFAGGQLRAGAARLGEGAGGVDDHSCGGGLDSVYRK